LLALLNTILHANTVWRIILALPLRVAPAPLRASTRVKSTP
jgi:hypothetical protein